MLAEHFQAFLMQAQPHVLRYVAIGIAIAAAAGIIAYYLYRKNRSKTSAKT